MENPGFGRRMMNCCKVHWNGWFYLISPLVLLPLVFVEPHVEFRTIFMMLWSFLWYVSGSVPVGIVGILPIVLFPVLGLMSSGEVCMAYVRDSQMVFMLSVFMAAVIENSGLYKRMAFEFLSIMSRNPKIILVIFMLQSYIVSLAFPDAIVCALMMPYAKGVLEILENTNVIKTIDESKEPKDDESPYNTKFVNALYIGIAYAINIGGMATIHSAEVGLSLEDLVADSLPKSSLEDGLSWKYLSISLPISFLLLLFTMLYLEIIFLGLFRKNSAAAQEIVFDKYATKSAMQSIKDDVPSYNVHMILTCLLYCAMLLVALVMHFIDREINEKVIKYSFVVMIFCYLYFVLPRNCDFCNYFICRKPNAYKTATSILTWAVANKTMPWNYFLAYGGSLAFGLLMKTSGIYKFFGQFLVRKGGTFVKQICLLAITLLFTLLGANHMVTDFMLKLGAQVALTNKIGPALILFPIMWSSCLSFILPVSCVANSFAGGWAKLRPKDMLLAGIIPTIIGFFLAVFGCLIAGCIPYMTKLAY